MQKLQALWVIIAVGGSSAAAVANTDLASFSYDSLAGSFVETGGAGSGVGNFSALAVNLPGLRSSGIVSRLVSPISDARFPSGFTGNALAGSSGFQLNLSVAVTGVGVATGIGTFNVVDVDGDQLTGTVVGQWSSQTSNFITFQGALTNVVFVDNGAADNTFNGLVGAVQMSPFPALSPFTGALVQLTFGAPSFFGTGFTNRNTAVSAQVIPAPAALALMGMGGLVAGRRRR
jgi:hypothetical protein